MASRRRAAAGTGAAAVGVAAIAAGALLLARGSAVAEAVRGDGGAGRRPAEYCRRVGTDDAPRPIPESLVPAAKRLFGLKAMPGEAVRRTTVFRCMNGAVLVCNTGANLPCGKADTGRDLPAAGQYCHEHPGSPFIPMFVTGHDSIYRWRCEGAQAAAEGPVERVDERGFVARLWKPVSG